jgi:hypothetical protein
VNDQLCFGEEKHTVTRFYRTIWAGVAHSFKTYGINDHNLNVALCMRQFYTREPGVPGYHQWLQARQRLFVGQHMAMAEYLAERYVEAFPFTDDFVELVRVAKSDPHEKKALREQAWRDLDESGSLGDPNSTWINVRPKSKEHVTGKMKGEEYNKPDKPGRIIIDMATPASLLGFLPAEWLKQAQNIETEYMGGTFYFCKTPEPAVLREVFDKLEDPPGRYYFVFFSDDSCLALRHEGRVYRYNLDIKKCDVSHTGALFEFLQRLFPWRLRKLARRLCDQCRAPMRVRSACNRKKFVDFQPLDYSSYSGWTFTTAINNCACILICCAIAEASDLTPWNIADIALRVGYQLEGCTPLELMEDLQFLKHSPVWTPDGWFPLLNLGVLLRATGTCKGDLPGRGPLRPRADAFQKGLLDGMYPRVSFPLIRGMKQVVAHAKVTKDVKQKVNKHLDWKVTGQPLQAVLRSEDVYLRYRLTAAEIEFLDNEFSGMQFGNTANSSGIHKILTLDYGAGTTDMRAPFSWDGHPYPQTHHRSDEPFH